MAVGAALALEIVLAIILVAVPAGISRFEWNQLPNVIRQATEIGLFIQMQLVIIVLSGVVARRVFLFLAGRTFKQAASYGAHGTSRFAKKSELMNDSHFAKRTWKKSAQENLRNPSGIVFGLLERKPLILPEETTIPNRNIFLVGSPGSGKTQSYLLTNLIHEQERSIVVTDPKGEIYETTAKLKEEQGYEVRLVNFLEMNLSDRYNPLDYVMKETDAEQVATTIVANSGEKSNSENDFWTRSEIALLKTLLLYVRYECPEEANLAKVKEILTVQGRTPKKMDQFFGNLPTDHPAYQSYQIVRMAEDRTRASIFISLGITLSKFDASDVRKFTEKSDFSLDDIGKKKMVVYCILPIADATWEQLTSTFFTQLFQRLYYVADHHYNKLPVKVNFLLDEFVNIGKIPRFEQVLATCRSYGISISTIVQSMGQLVDLYTKERAEGIIGNCSLRYLLGVSDKMTADYFSELIGKTTIQTRSTSFTKGKEENSSLSKQYGERLLITPDELTRMGRNEGILLISGMFPVKLRKTYQWEFFKGILHDQNRSSRFAYQAPMSLELEDMQGVLAEQVNDEQENEQHEQNLDNYLDQAVEKLESRLRSNLTTSLEKELDDLLAKLTPTAPDYTEQKFDLLREFFMNMKQNHTD
jgi:type IV secretion system protein VirD4